MPIAVRKYDGHRRFTVETMVFAATPALLVARGQVGRRFITATRTDYLSTITLEYFPAGRWYNVLSYFEATTGALERHFCNIIAPADWDGTTLSYIDLDLDLSIAPDGAMMVEDLDDFRRNARRWHYPTAVRHGALTALRDLRNLAARGVPPFTAASLAEAEATALAGGTVWGWRSRRRGGTERAGRKWTE